MIKRLRTTQAQRVPEFIDKWAASALSTEPANRAEAEQGINFAYQVAGFPPPRIVWCSSPYTLLLTRSLTMDITGDSLGGVAKTDIERTIWDQVRDTVRDVAGRATQNLTRLSVEEELRKQTESAVYDSLHAWIQSWIWSGTGEPVKMVIEDAVLNSATVLLSSAMNQRVWQYVQAALQDPLTTAIESQLARPLSAALSATSDNGTALMILGSQATVCYGQHSAGWLAAFDFYGEVCGLRAETARLAGLKKIARNAGWFVPHEHVCWVSERPNLLLRDPQGRLHCEDGPAVRYPDGWVAYFWHGARVPARVVQHPGWITIREIERETNTEVRRILIERYGPGNYIRDLGAQKVCEDEFGVLYHARSPREGRLAVVQVINSTPEPDGSFREYWLSVPPGIRTAREGVAWSFGLRAMRYQPVMQT